MKKIILIYLLCAAFYAELCAEPFVRFEAGNATRIREIYFTEAELGYKFTFWGIESRTYGGWLTWAERGSSVGKPFMNIYSFGQKITYKHFFIHFKHYCAHSVNSDILYQKNNRGEVINRRWKVSPYWWDGSMETVSMGFEYNLK